LSDIGKIDENGYIHVMGRSDDVLNVAGHRLSTGATDKVLEQCLAIPKPALSVACRKHVRAKVSESLNMLVLRRTLKSIANKEACSLPATIEDPSVLAPIFELFGSFQLFNPLWTFNLTAHLYMLYSDCSYWHYC
jgi:hypothetical protein